MWQLLCGIHSLFQVDTFNLSTIVPFSDTMWWNAWLFHCELPFCHTTLMMQQLMTRGHHSFRTSIVICELYGTSLRYLPWNVCIKMYLRIGEAKNPGPTLDQRPNLNRSLNRSNRTQTEHCFRLSNLQLIIWSLFWKKHLGSIVLTMNSCTCL